ncbi:MAG: 1-phosphofructokinase family hexose kinase, partial [Erysipelotrichaceae bacterium]|nr:1-phosphofructokinase family hexose kinase [Erysipelotrichaceae bacterium]
MIYTVTFNPSIDLFVEADLTVGELNRVSREEYMAGGKGLNVSMICHELEMDTVATGFLGGFTGEFVKQEMDRMNVVHHFIEAEGITRINMKIAGIDETEINLTGVHVTREHFEQLYQFLNKSLTKDDTLIISGNSANGIDKDDYGTLCQLANDKGSLLVVDTNQAYLEFLLPYHPFLIKPNVSELAGVFETTISSEEDIVKHARQLQKLGAVNVLVSNGSKGAILVGE